MKTQVVRLADVFLLGPFMIYAALKKDLTPAERAILAGIGVGTVIYNWRNYRLEKEGE